MSMFPLSLLIAAGCIIAAISHLNQIATSYYDFVALTIVLGGTLAVGISVIPWQYVQEIRLAFKTLFFSGGNNRSKRALHDCLSYLQGFQQIDKLKLDRESLYGQILIEGAEMIGLGIKTDRIETILRERVFQESKRRHRVANSLRSLAKYPPAFGLIGTVLGLVNVMRGISQEIGSKETGLLMAIALVATLYGLLLSNLIINPAGEMILKWSSQEEDLGILSLQTVLLASEKVSLLESQELLNSFVNTKCRVNILNQYMARYEDAA